MKDPVIIIGMGEMGGVFARGFLRTGHPVYPVTRSMDPAKVAAAVSRPAAVLVASGEGDLQPILQGLPGIWRDRLCLLQNELLPNDWSGFADPTVISVWFEKKRGMEAKVIIPSPVYGPRARLVADALGSLEIPTTILDSQRELLFELVVKNLYILTSNIAGLQVGGTVGELWSRHQPLARDVANDVITLQESLAGEPFDRERLIAAMVRAFDGDPAHRCTGRTAHARLVRALEHADRLGLELPTLHRIAARATD